MKTRAVGRGDVTEAAQVARVMPQDPELYDEPDGMPTKAVTVYNDAFDDGADPTAYQHPRPSDDVLDPDTHDGESEEEATKFGSFIPANDGARAALPGFVESDADSDTAPPQRRRPNNPESVIVSPAPIAAQRKQEPRSDPPRARPTPAFDPPKRAAASGTPERAARAARPKSPPKRSPPRRRSSASMSRNLLLLAGLLCIAVALGIGIGVLVASLKTTPPKPVPVVVSTLEPRITNLEREMEVRSKRGEPVPPEAWKLIANARAAMMEGNGPLAEQRVAEAEKLIK